jgi:KUP system potassium uptake protein
MTSPATAASTGPAPASPSAGALSATLILSALGVVFGDIATSPLYAFKAAFDERGIEPTHDNVIGLLSVTCWALILVVSCKYIAFIMRADNRGEGGIMSLLALARSVSRSLPRWIYVCVVWLGLGGAAFFFGDSVITPAVSVISAVEGLELAAPELKQFVVPLSVLILLALFFLQRVGSDRVGRLFGPVMVAWLLSLGGFGLLWLLRHPVVLEAVDPRFAWHYFGRNGFRGFESLGAVVLVVTGTEALYADMGHFGAKPIRAGWFGLVLPCLLLNYFGQGALLLISPDAVSQSFYKMVPPFLLYPMIVLASLATVVASQAVIAGTFSMAKSAMLLGFLPRMDVEHTSKAVGGQVYLPGVNFLLFVFIIGAVLLFKSSDALAAAYGIAVSGTMMATTLLALLVARRSWRWPMGALVPLALVLLSVDAAFFGANILKITSGGWFPLALGFAMYVVMLTWRRGRRLLIARVTRNPVVLADFIASLATLAPFRVDGVAVFLTAQTDGVPHALVHNMKANQSLHKTNILLNVRILEVPRVAGHERLEHRALEEGFHVVTMRFGFAEDTDVPEVLREAAIGGFDFDKVPVTYFISRGQPVAKRFSGMARWRASLFAFLMRNASPATARFHLPENRLIEIGAPIDV